MNKNNPYGYKIGYRHNNGFFVRLFITKTRKRAYHVLNYYQKYGHIGYRKNEIERFNYLIKPITKKEVLAGIWNELPFQRKTPPLSVTYSLIHDLLSIAIILRSAFFLPLNAGQRLQLLHPLLQEEYHLLLKK